MTPLLNRLTRRQGQAQLEFELALERSLERLGSAAGSLVAAREPDHAFELRGLLAVALELHTAFEGAAPPPAARAELLAGVRQTPQHRGLRLNVRGRLDWPGRAGRFVLANGVARRGLASAAVAMAVGALALLGGALQSTPAAAATLTVVSGAVERLRGEAPGAVLDGAMVFEGDTLRLGPDSIAILTFRDGSTVQLSAGAELTLARARFETAPVIRVEQRAGQVIADLPRATGHGSSLTVQAPEAVIEAHSGGFAAGVSSEGTRVQAFEDPVAVRSGAGPEVVVPGESRLIERSGLGAPERRQVPPYAPPRKEPAEPPSAKPALAPTRPSSTKPSATPAGSGPGHEGTPGKGATPVVPR